MNVSIRELKSHLSEVLKLVTEGEAVIVTRRGRPIARVSALVDDHQGTSTRARLAQADWITAPKKPGRTLGTHAPLPGEADGKTLAEVVAEERG